jgi:hypothetical protein
MNDLPFHLTANMLYCSSRACREFLSTVRRSLFDKHAGLKARNESMDKDEAERLARAIRMVHMDWIKVGGVAYNPTTDQYEVQCEYQQAGQVQAHSKESWTTLQIKSPRQWIEVLMQHGGGLELP